MLDLAMESWLGKRMAVQQEGKMSPGKGLPWKPTPPGKGLTLTIHRNAGQQDSRRHCSNGQFAQGSSWEARHCVGKGGPGREGEDPRALQ